MFDVTIIKLVLNTLEGIEIKGRDNIEAMLGSMNALESLIQIAEAQKESTKQEEVNG